MSDMLKYIGQACVYAAFAVLLGYFANAPRYVHFPPDRAMIKLSFAHGGAAKGGCHRRTPAELAKLPPNMRKLMDCPRERVPLLIELVVDDTVVHRGWAKPTGLAGDGPARVYEKFPVAPGEHSLVVRLRDSMRTEGYDYESAAMVRLAALQNLVIDFRSETGEFVFR